jgi:hypothetical protein
MSKQATLTCNRCGINISVESAKLSEDTLFLNVLINAEKFGWGIKLTSPQSAVMLCNCCICKTH